jgi:F0F1-type ATP synthase assembly protein I
MPDQPTRSQAMGYVIAISQVGFEMVVPIGLGVFLDLRLGTMPLLTVVGVLLGLFGGMAHLLVLLRKLDQVNHTDQPPKTPS